MVDSLRRLFSRKRTASYEDDAIKDMPARKLTVQDSGLLRLPDELLLYTLGFLDFDSLLRLRLTQSHLNDLAQEFVFQSFEVHHGRRAAQLAAMLRRDERRALWLRSLLISTRHDEDEGLHALPPYMESFTNLRDLVLETPDCNARPPAERIKWIELQNIYEDIFRRASVAVPATDRLLPNLETCTLHFVDNEVSLYPLSKYSNMPQRILQRLRQYKRTTSLRHMHLEECDFDSESLQALLKLPKALESLKISEGVRYNNNGASRPSRVHGNLNPGLFSRALVNAASHSLEYLSLNLGYQHSRGHSITSPGRSLDLRLLTKLKKIDVSMTTLGLIVPRPGCDHAIYRRLPDSIEHIRVFEVPLLKLRARPPTPLRPCLFTQKAVHGLPNLKEVTYCYEYQALRGNSSFGLFQRGGEDTLSRIIDASKKRVININNKNYPTYHESNMHVVIEVEITPPGYIPPYLHNEEHPTIETIWDSNEPTFEALVHLDNAQKARDKADDQGQGSESSLARSIAETQSQVTIDPAQLHPTPAQTPQQALNWLLGGAMLNTPNTIEDESDDEEGGSPLLDLPPQAAELLELLIQIPGQPFQV
ncbi:hypothetical protein LTR64_001511 [Lithohypha guttulata]|uniref:uncharacterized protein n=1 Tax=Lithohypha guttulata TaxID=1690604 RepID=UPI002DDDFBF7|nr:hypothetical protein LTR51_003705 [Lithohypha guttulata]